MTEEEKLLLKDLAARVPYGVMVEQTLFSSDLADKDQRLKSVQANNCVKLYWNKYNLDDFVPIHCIKPYLRPIHKLTKEELEELEFLTDGDYVDYCNEHHIDYRNLIPKGLALEAPEGMYKQMT